MDLQAAQAFLDQYSQAVSAVAEAVSASVVRVERRGGEHGHGRRWHMGRARVGHGSGVIIDAEQGHILTSYHVVSGTQEARVHLADGRAVDARRIGKDPENDLALVKVDPSGLGLRALRLGGADSLMVGSAVLALGNPDGDRVVVTAGIVSALSQSLRGPSGQLMYGLIQTSALFNPGMSGGPLVNSRGEVVGLNTASMVEGKADPAISSPTIQKVLPDLIAHGEVRRPKLGLLGERERLYAGLVAHHRLDQTHGVEVLQVTENSPAAKAGIRAGDILIAVDGEAVAGMDALARILMGHRFGDTLSVRLIRDLDVVEVKVKLEAPAG
jgi:S1-C subfamily serine protease